MSNLSPFHQEILGFLGSQARERMKVEGYDLNLDAEAREFQKVVEDGLLPLDEIVENYNHLFGERGPVHVECRWMGAFSEKEFAELGLGAYFPRIYRGLPRFYTRDNPTRSFIKKNFTNVGDLKRLSVDRAVFSLYEGVAPKRAWKVGIFSWVMPDGLGDWVAAVEAAKCIRAKMPWLDIHLFIVSNRELPKCEEFPVHVYDREELAKMDFVLQIPTFYPELDMPTENVGEYGFLESSWFHPKSGNRSMGLHVLEKGIFIRKVQRTSFAEVKQKRLLQVLFGTELPGPAEIDAYEKRSRFHLGYLATPLGGAIYLHSLLKMWERDEKDIDVCCPDLSWFIQWIEGRGKVLEEPFGVKEIVVQLLDQRHVLPIGEKGKTLQLICPGEISLADMQRLIYLSGEWVGVRGNQSLTEAISAGKAFFYDGRDHARYLIKDIVAMAENRLSQHVSARHAFRMMGQAFLWNLPEDTNEWVDESHFQKEGRMDWFAIAAELGTSLQDPDAIAGFKKFCKICADEHAFNPFLCHLVERGLVPPEIRETEKGLMQLYGVGKISFSTLVKNLRLRMMQI